MNFVNEKRPLNSTAIRLPSGIYGSEIRLTGGSARDAQTTDKQRILGAERAFLGAAKDVFRCRQRNCWTVGMPPARRGVSAGGLEERDHQRADRANGRPVGAAEADPGRRRLGFEDDVHSAIVHGGIA